MKQFLLVLFLSLLFIPLSSQTRWESIVLAGDTWRYFPATSEPPGNWNSVDFNDTTWPIDPGGIGYGDGDDVTIIAPVNSLYIRLRFEVTQISLIERLLLDVDYDDGFVAYLNGNEIARSENVTGSSPSYNSSVQWLHEALMYKGGLPERHSVDMQYLVEGENTLAVHILNESTGSSDLTGLVYLHAKVNNAEMIFRPTPAWFTEPAEEGESNLPILMINTHGQVIVDEPKITASLGIIDNANQRNRITDPFTSQVDYIGIEIRGSSSQMFEKKNYGFETRLANGENLNVSLLGLPEENDWALHGPYSDKTLMRNVLTFYLGSKTGRWAPRTRFCELYINNDYRGLYVLMERIKRDRNRVDIAKLEPHEVSGSDLTGGYILSIDRPEDYYWISPYKGMNGYGNILINIIYPDPSTMPIQQKQYIQNYVTQFENAMNSSSFTNQYTGYRAYANIESFVDYFIMNEISRNVDAYRLSTFFYKDKDKRMVMGPLWDYNLAFGNADYYQGYNTQGWVIQGVGYNDGFQIPFWWEKIRTDSYFNNKLKDRWIELRAGPFSKDSIMAYIDSIGNLLSEAQVRNFQRFQVLGRYVWPNYFVGNTYQQEIDFMKNWISARINWMDQQINLITGVDEISIANAWETFAFPNPFSHTLSIRTFLHQASNLQISIYGLLGQLLFKTAGTYPEGAVDITVPAEIFGNGYGLYIFEVRVNGRILHTGKVVRVN